MQNRRNDGVFINTGLLADKVHHTIDVGDVWKIRAFAQLPIMDPSGGVDGTKDSLTHKNRVYREQFPCERDYTWTPTKAVGESTTIASTQNSFRVDSRS